MLVLFFYQGFVLFCTRCTMSGVCQAMMSAYWSRAAGLVRHLFLWLFLCNYQGSFSLHLPEWIALIHSH